MGAEPATRRRAAKATQALSKMNHIHQLLSLSLFRSLSLGSPTCIFPNRKGATKSLRPRARASFFRFSRSLARFREKDKTCAGCLRRMAFCATEAKTTLRVSCIADAPSRAPPYTTSKAVGASASALT